MQYQPSVWEALCASPLPLVLYGTGDGADKILSVLSRWGRQPDHIFVSDDFYREQSFHGQPVTTLSALEATYPDFLIVPAFGSHLPAIHARIRSLAARHPMLIPDVPVCGEALFDLSFVRAHRDELTAAYALLADEASRTVFRQVVEYKLTGRPEPLFASESPKADVFSSLLPLGPSEHYLDLGAYRGDTLEEFVRAVPEGRYASMTAFEPDPTSFRKLREAWGHYPGVTLYEGAVGRQADTLYLRRRRGRGSLLMPDPPGTPIPVRTVDSLAIPVTYLKMDLEGGEADALLGAADVLAYQKPRLNIACYHRNEDLFRLPLLLHSLQPSYRLFLRRHPCIPCWDLNLYARP